MRRGCGLTKRDEWVGEELPTGLVPDGLWLHVLHGNTTREQMSTVFWHCVCWAVRWGRAHGSNQVARESQHSTTVVRAQVERAAGSTTRVAQGEKKKKNKTVRHVPR